MLFDLRGRRRRLVQATYLMLALLMGGGLVLFGIGGDVSGGLFNAFEGDGGGGNPNSAIEERIDRQEERLKANPQNTALLQSLVRDYYGLATSQQETGSTSFPDDAKDELRKAGAYWQRYVNAVSEKPSADTAMYALRVFDVGGLNQPKRAQEAAAIIAEAQNDASSYLQLVAYAALAKDKRTADLAAQKAVDLAPEDQREQVKAQAEALKQPQPQQQESG
ncbi:MAG TPA: hypothetical protein VE270_05985 [Thermoleophilaceae bacterium]|nr:hypothetical protein [Thermoleophilaceae bacterium]